MGRPPCCDEAGLKKGPWTPEEDKKLVDYIEEHGHGKWSNLPKNAGLNRCGKSCRLRWTNYLRPDIKRGKFSEDEERQIVHLHSILGNKWSAIATHLSGRTDNEIKNYWNTHVKKKLLLLGIDPRTHQPITNLSMLTDLHNVLNCSLPNSWDYALRVEADDANIDKNQVLQSLIQDMAFRSHTVDTGHLLNMSQLGSYQFNNQIMSHHQLEGLTNHDSISIPHLISHPQPTNSHIYYEPSLPHEENQIMPQFYGSCSDVNDTFANQIPSSYDLTLGCSNSLLASPYRESIATNNAQEQKIDRSVFSANSSMMIPFTALQGHGLEEIDSKISWKDILDQIP